MTLQIFPPDPASLFRGDEVQLRYSISLLDLDRLPSSGDFEAGDPVYVVLKPGTPYWTADRVSASMPVFRTHHAVIKGTVAYHWRNRTGPPDAKGQLDVTYGIESYAVPEAQAVELKNQCARRADFGRRRGRQFRPLRHQADPGQRQAALHRDAAF